MAKDAAQRYASMRDFGKALRAYLQAGTCGLAVGRRPDCRRGGGPRGSLGSGATAAPEPASFPDKIEFACPECGLPVRTPLATAGKKGKCPSCGAIVLIPESPSAAPASRPAANVPPARPRPAAPPQRIDFSCPHCGNLVRTPLGAAGKKGRCPSCSRVVDIPDLGYAVESPTPRAAGSCWPSAVRRPRRQHGRPSRGVVPRQSRLTTPGRPSD